MAVYVAEVAGKAVAAIEAADIELAEQQLTPAVLEMNHEMFDTGWPEPLEEAEPVYTREASSEEVSQWEKSKSKTVSGGSEVVWLIPI
jgi:hypothetical protein